MAQACLPSLHCSLLAWAGSCVTGTRCTAFISLLSKVQAHSLFQIIPCGLHGIVRAFSTLDHTSHTHAK